MDRFTGEYIPMLAESWDANEDFTNWTFSLRQGVPFHRDWGEFWAEDFAHSLEMLVRDESNSADAEFWRENLQDVKIIDNFTVELVFHRPNQDITSWVSSQRDLVMLSSAQWNAIGDEGIRESGPVGTGPYRFLGRDPGFSILFDRVENHWRQTPNFEELEIRYVAEDVVKLAMVRANEADIAEIQYPDLKDALDFGLEASFSAQPAFELTYFYPGLFREDSDLFVPENPFEDFRVREAFARAVDRELINEIVFGEMGEPAHVLACHPTDPCFDHQWEADLFDLYGYDPDRSRQLLAEAGYPDGFPLQIAILRQGRFQEVAFATEIIASMAAEAGFTPEIVEMESTAFRRLMNDREVTQVFGLALSNTQMTEAVRFFNYSGTEGPGSGPERVLLDEIYEIAVERQTPQDRVFLEMEMGGYKFYEYLELPLLWLPALALVNPDTVAEYAFPGTVPGHITHLEYVEPAR